MKKQGLMLVQLKMSKDEFEATYANKDEYVAYFEGETQRIMKECELRHKETLDRIRASRLSISESIKRLAEEREISKEAQSREFEAFMQERTSEVEEMEAKAQSVVHDAQEKMEQMQKMHKDSMKVLLDHYEAESELLREEERKANRKSNERMECEKMNEAKWEQEKEAKRAEANRIEQGLREEAARRLEAYQRAEQEQLAKMQASFEEEKKKIKADCKRKIREIKELRKTINAETCQTPTSGELLTKQELCESRQACESGEITPHEPSEDKSSGCQPEPMPSQPLHTRGSSTPTPPSIPLASVPMSCTCGGDQSMPPPCQQSPNQYNRGQQFVSSSVHLKIRKQTYLDSLLSSQS